MTPEKNKFKAALQDRARVTYGLWAGLGDNIAAEICACAGFDWLLLDGEHGPLDARHVLSCLQAIAPYPTNAIFRPLNDDPALLKRMLDVGVQSFLIPMVNSPDQARDIVRAVRYPPDGIRGLGTSLARAARWNLANNYVQLANDEICTIVQIETSQALSVLPEIAAVEGVDAVFIGPSDLGASIGYPGQPSHPDVVKTVCDAIEQVRAIGKPAGVLAVSPDLVSQYIEVGASFVGIGTDTGILAKGAKNLIEGFRGLGPGSSPQVAGEY